MNRCVLLVYAFAMSLTAACNRPEAKEADRTLPSMSPPVTVPSSPAVRGLYLGVSDDEAWLIYLEPGSAASTMYRPLDALALCDVKTDAGGAVAFRSAASGSHDPFQFAGRLSHDTLSGTMTMVGERTGAVTARWSIAPRRVLPRFLTGAPDSLSGAYYKFDEGSDITGTEVVLLDLADRVVGFAQTFQGGPDAVFDISGNRVKDTLHVTWRSLKSSWETTMLIRGDTVTLFGGRERAPKGYSIPEMFRAPNREECK